MFYQLVQDLEEEGQWVDEKLTICSATIQAKDLRALTSLQQKHNSLCDEMVWRQNRFKSGALASAEEIIAGHHPKADYCYHQNTMQSFIFPIFFSIAPCKVFTLNPLCILIGINSLLLF